MLGITDNLSYLTLTLKNRLLLLTEVYTPISCHRGRTELNTERSSLAILQTFQTKYNSFSWYLSSEHLFDLWSQQERAWTTIITAGANYCPWNILQTEGDVKIKEVSPCKKITGIYIQGNTGSSKCKINRLDKIPLPAEEALKNMWQQFCHR